MHLLTSILPLTSVGVWSLGDQWEGVFTSTAALLGSYVTPALATPTLATPTLISLVVS